MESNVITKVSCKECGEELPLDHKGTCPKCGKTGRNIKAMVMEKIGIKESKSWVHIREFIKKNPIIIFLCILIILGTSILGYFISGLIGVIIGIISGFGVSILGFFAVIKVREIHRGGA